MPKQVQKKLKVCHLTSVHPYQDERIYLKECLTLVNLGYETHLIAPAAPDEIREGIHLHSVPKLIGNRLLRMTKTTWDVYKQALGINADIYHFHDPELVPIGLALKAKGKRVIYDVHEDVPRQVLSKSYIPPYFRHPASTITESLENIASKKFDGIVAATPFIRDRFLQVAANAIDINNFPILEEFSNSEAIWEQKERIVCYVGGIWQERGLFEMLKAIDQIDAELFIAGNFPNQQQRDQAMLMPGWQKVRELGYVDRQQVATTLAKSMAGLVVLHPIINYVDALPVKMFEYMSASIPVIASNFPLWQQIIDENQCGICVDPMNPQEIAQAIQFILDHPSIAKQMGENGRRAIESKYNWKNEQEKLGQFYQEIAFSSIAS